MATDGKGNKSIKLCDALLVDFRTNWKRAQIKTIGTVIFNNKREGWKNKVSGKTNWYIYIYYVCDETEEIIWTSASSDYVNLDIWHGRLDHLNVKHMVDTIMLKKVWSIK